MAYFEPSIDAEGIHIPTYDDIMEYLIAQYKAIFGDDVYIKEDTKDYQLLSVFAKCMDDYAALVVDSYNARNPNYATGDSLDLLLPLVSMRRREATPSKVVLKLSGTAGTVIPSGSVAIDKNGVLWNLDSGATLDGDGEAEVNATCDVDGAIDAPIGSINEIYTPVVGWDEVTNEAEAVVGRNVETDDELRFRRKQSVNLENNGSYDALMRSLLNLEVDDKTLEFVKVLVNDADDADDNGIPAHSICCICEGLDDAESAIAEAIWKAKSPGVGTYYGPSGTTRRSVNYVDRYGNTNVIQFARPKKSNVTVAIIINALGGYDEDRVLPMITESILGAINELGIGNSWGVTTAYRDIYNAFAGEECPFVVASVTGKTSSMGSASSVEVPADFNELLICEDTDITITVNT